MEEGIREIVTRLVLQLAVILVAAKVFGEIAERIFHQPSVLGELLAGVLIGPFALGAVTLPLEIGPLFLGTWGPLFPLLKENEGFIPVSNELYAFAQVASIVLLFVAGLETDLGRFFRFAPQATAVAVGGVVLPFLLADASTVLLGFAPDPLHPTALFMGAVSTATSVGITARVLSDLRRLDTPEGVTVLGAAVVDDVLGILVLTIVVGMGGGESVAPAAVALVGVKAVGFWLVLLVGGIALSRFISAVISRFQVQGANLALSLALAFLASALAESFGLAMIIGAYSIGLALSGTQLARRLEEPVAAVYQALVPIFFVVMGMLVNVPAMVGVLTLGLVITAGAIVGKIVGCGLPALAVGFNLTGASRIGIGMLPRGEVALIIAGVGLVTNTIGPELFGVSILMTAATTLLAPVLLVPLFQREGSGLRQRPKGTPTASPHP
ncbi:MAG: cation:proton antiporter [Chloroflexi bacterium]|nr:cation:proton antiporter [Chloroflexota bacterium]